MAVTRLAAALLLVSLLSFAQVDPQRLARIPERMQEFVDAKTAAGFVTLVAHRGEILQTSATGLQVIESNTKMRTDSIFQIASMTKPITAAAIMILADEGRLSVGDAVEKHLPEFRGQKMVSETDGARTVLAAPPRKITLHDLLTHTSGMPGGSPAGLAEIFVDRDRTLSEAVAVYSQRPLSFEPGARWQYSNMGIATLGRIIEVVSGMPYQDFLASRIFQPLGMVDSFFFPPKEKYDRIAAIYDAKDGRLIRDPRDLYRAGAKYPAPEGGLYSTAGDLYRFYQMMLNDGEGAGKRILSSSAVSVMTQLHTADIKAGFAPGMGWGYGWSVVRNTEGTFRFNSIGTYGHGGAYRTYAFVDPHKQLVGIILFQRVAGGGDMADEISAFIQMANAAIVD